MASYRELRTLIESSPTGWPDYPRGLLEDARAYAQRRATREGRPVYVYARGGVVFVRGEGEPQPEGSQIIYATAFVKGE